MDNNKNNKRGVMNNIGFLVKNICKWDKKVLFYFGLCTIVTAILPFISIFAPKFLIDELMGANRAKSLITILLSYFVISAALNYLNAFLEGAYSPRLMDIGFRFESLLNEKCMNMDFKYTQDPKTLNDIETAGIAVSGAVTGIQGVLRKLFGLFGAGIAFLGYVTIVVTLSPWVLLYLIVNVATIYCLTIKVKKYEYSKKDDISELNRKGKYIYDIMYNFAYGKDIRIFNLSQRIANKFQGFNIEQVKIHKDIKYKYFKVDVVDAFLLFIREGLVYVYLIYKVIYGGMSIGNFAMYSAIIAGFAAWMQKILDDIAHINAQNLYINDYRNFLETDLNVENSNYVDIPKEENYEIEFKNVSFKYPSSERYIYKNLSLKINKGQRLAIVGVNGAGKTTFVKLLTRLYEPTEGEILLNGVKIANFGKEEYYKLFSVVFQEIKIFAFSIAENIALKDTDKIDTEKVLKSVHSAGMEEKINSLENGIDTSLLKILDSTGTELSGGENQKLALARGLYKDGPIVILDEPTAALDPIAEYKVYKSFNSMIGSKTALFISHRLASTRFCDVIAFFEDGEIQEYGTHEELLNKNGKYAEMFNVQASYYREESLENEGA
ncbi:MAG: ABC transporter ATP-binding protein [Clostridium sp.]|uniref:ABC transporter ATP-binding protein n=1 Tax=Clostridium sp. TaxID=1506 RepID=UPI003D6D88D1